MSAAAPLDSTHPRILIPITFDSSTPTSLLDFQTPPQDLSIDALQLQIRRFNESISAHLSEATDKRRLMYRGAVDALHESPLSELQHFMGSVFPNDVNPLETISEMEQSPLMKQSEKSPETSMVQSNWPNQVLDLVTLPKEQTVEVILEFKTLLHRSREIEAAKEQCRTMIKLIQMEQSGRHRVAKIPEKQEKFDACQQELDRIDAEVLRLDALVAPVHDEITGISRRLASGKGDKVVLKQRKSRLEVEKTELQEQRHAQLKKKPALEGQLATIRVELGVSKRSLEVSQKMDKKRISKEEDQIATLDWEGSAISSRLQGICKLLSEHLTVTRIDGKMDTMKMRLSDLQFELDSRR